MRRMCELLKQLDAQGKRTRLTEATSRLSARAAAKRKTRRWEHWRAKFEDRNMQLLIAATGDYPGGDGGQARPFRSGGIGDPPGRARVGRSLVPAIIREVRHVGKPQPAMFGGRYDS